MQKEGRQMSVVTIHDVARRTGLSISTVSQALNGKGRISEKTRALVRKMADELGYIPDSRARSMRVSRSKAIGLLVPDVRNGYFSELVYAVQDELYINGYATLIGVSLDDTKRQDDFFRTILARHIDGAIVVPRNATSPILRVVLDRGLPVVFVDRRDGGAPQIPLVDSDPEPGLEQALQSLAEHGHRKVAYIPGPDIHPPVFQERQAAFTALSDRRRDIQGIVVRDYGDRVDDRRRIMRSLVDQGVTAFIFGYSGDAIRAIAIVNEDSWAFRDKVALVSFDDLDLFRLVTPQVSVISQQVDRMGRLGVGVLLDLVEAGGAEGGRGVAVRLGECRRMDTVFTPRGLLS